MYMVPTELANMVVDLFAKAVITNAGAVIQRSKVSVFFFLLILLILSEGTHTREVMIECLC
jgi:hypothetical protein